MDPLTTQERVELSEIAERLASLRRYVEAFNLSVDDPLDAWFVGLDRMKAIQGNTSNALSFVACLMAKRYLMAHHAIAALDVAAKPQGAPGLDIDVCTEGGQRIVAEIKTTVPYSGARNDLGAQQRESFRRDFAKLRQANADVKYFFVTDDHTFEIVNRKYAAEIPGVEIVCLRPATPVDT